MHEKKIAKLDRNKSKITKIKTIIRFIIVNTLEFDV